MENVRYPENEEERHLAQRANELTDVIKKVFQNRDAVQEVNAAIFSGFYKDEIVALKDLVYPEESKLLKVKSLRS